MNLWTELKRRNVIRVTTAYIVVTWLLLQVVDIVLDLAGAPDWVGRVVLWLLIVGLIPTVVLAWVFERTPEGLQRDDGKSRSAGQMHARRLDIITIVAVVLLAGMLLWQQRSARDSSADADIARKAEAASDAAASRASAASIAVLPFDDLSPEGDQEYFSTGIAEEILNVLVRVSDLSVASRTSAFAFRGQEALGIPAIADALGVRHILDGSVRRAGDTIRITAQLIDAETDKQLWSDSYDRELSTENIFAIQDEIANAIVSELARSMSLGAGISVRVAADTGNLDAYQLFLRGRQQFLERSYATVPDTIAVLEQATNLDPAFARAWASLAAIYGVAVSWRYRNRDYNRLAEDAARRAIELNEDLALPYAVMAWKATGELPADFGAGMALYQQALDRDPREVSALLWRGIDRTALGFFEDASEDFNRCLRVDPAYDNCRRFLAVARLFAGDTEQAFLLFEEGTANHASSQGDTLAFAYAATGDHRAALHALASYFRAFDYPFSVDRVHRALTRPDFDYEKERREFEIEFQGRTGEALDWSRYPFVALALRAYEQLEPSKTRQVWWHPSFPHFLVSPHRKRLIREMGIDAYWRSHGFPPQCRPRDGDDFECD